MEIITLDECQLIFDNKDLLKKFLLKRLEFSIDEIEILLLSIDSYSDMMLIDIIYDNYVKLACLVNKSEIEIKLYDKLLNILNYHIRMINFNDKKSRFIKEFEDAILNYDNVDLKKVTR